MLELQNELHLAQEEITRLERSSKGKDVVTSLEVEMALLVIVPLSVVPPMSGQHPSLSERSQVVGSIARSRQLAIVTA